MNTENRVSKEQVSAIDIMKYAQNQAKIARFIIPEMKGVDQNHLSVVIASAIDNVLTDGKLITKCNVFKPEIDE